MRPAGGTPARKEEHGASHREGRARDERAFTRMKTRKILRKSRPKSDAADRSALAVARPRGMVLTDERRSKTPKR
ncbi:hypothetical protein SAMN05192584_11071 [Streptomyces pini]|uniref:Transposase n=1 Tax=Streptomyces pini TaxID=1520580 RepID=A0A1I4DFE9_9ACTN|nr:hypothetical protein SAMN05192584_11071 [Streptomyces pini]